MKKEVLRVAVIGGGPAGLIAIKECLDHGLQPVLYEKEKHHGGLWCAFTGKVWPDMRTNLSAHHIGFPDFPFVAKDSRFASQADVVQYLNDYSQHFKLDERCDVRRGHAVTSAKPVDGKWHVEANGVTDVFDKVIGASGVFSKPNVPKVNGIENVRGSVEHSSEIKPFAYYTGRKVTVVGNGFSGCDIAVGLAKAGAQVQHIFRRPYQVVPRVFDDNSTVDEMFYIYPEDRDAPHLSTEDKNLAEREYFAELLGDQSNASELLGIDLKSTEPLFVTVATDYLKMVKSNKIALCLGEVDRVNSQGHISVGGKALHTDDVIFATGYNTSLDYLDDVVLGAIDFDENDSFMPVPLSDGVWNNAYPNLGFVGMYRGPYFLTMALQAKWIAKAYSDPASFMPDAEEVCRGVDEAMALRNLTTKPQFPYGDFVGVVEKLSGKIGDYSYLEKGGQVVKISDFSTVKPLHQP